MRRIYCVSLGTKGEVVNSCELLNYVQLVIEKFCQMSDEVCE